MPNINLFKKTSSHWVRYDKYEWKKDAKGILYITPAEKAKPELYNPLKDSDKMVLHAINTGVICMNEDTDEQTKQGAVMDFISSYGLLGFMIALSTTPEFITYEAVYLPKNHFIKEERMTTEQYLSYFFPFDELDFVKQGVESSWSVSDPTMIALVMTMSDRPQAVTMSFQREYAEPYEWLVRNFTDWAFTFISSFYIIRTWILLTMCKKIYTDRAWLRLAGLHQHIISNYWKSLPSYGIFIHCYWQ